MLTVSVDSYITVSEETEIMCGTVYFEKWTSLTAEQQESALKFAAMQIYMLPFAGTKMSSAQMLEFSQKPDITVPQQAKTAQAFEAVESTKRRFVDKFNSIQTAEKVYSWKCSNSMSITEKYFTNKAEIQIYCGINDRGDTKYETKQQIKCRIDYTHKKTVDSKGNKIISTATMFTNIFIPALSIVYDECGNRFTVKNCKTVKRISGSTDQYEVIL